MESEHTLIGTGSVKKREKKYNLDFSNCSWGPYLQLQILSNYVVKFIYTPIDK